MYYDQRHVDDQLVRSILQPAGHPDAAAVFGKVIGGRGLTVNKLLAQLEAGGGTPLFLLWGANDPWIVPSKAAQIQALYPRSEKVLLRSGHCPHDDTPAEVNAELARWVAGLPQ